MHEKQKLREAAFFVDRMQEIVSDYEPFACYLSAFLSAARSVLQYAREEAKNNSQLTWYDGWAQDPVIKFFKDKRDMNIHERPVGPTRETSLVISDKVRISEELVIVKRTDDGENEILRSGAASDTTSGHVDDSEPATISHRFVFSDWSGPEDVPSLARRYLDTLRAFIDDGVRKGFITG